LKSLVEYRVTLQFKNGCRSLT